ncbi:hypothetical protein [Methylocystis bryophila]|uniref:TonB C-terminal domain-containing protein n=1 Tax=Methylocystis bryophila TaxID=655015 RepID=A0A1W6MT32_9HYPH|nr:hypothetical protein [Methylocystis bryophila]ARN80771.1 hypothetical protein B1812_06430 [Methylocystis bryophila]BDV40851.1 hypothetical protein DSM21852_41040 [Methylocystis bryophila]
MRPISIVLMLAFLGVAGAASAEEQSAGANKAQAEQPSGAGEAARGEQPSTPPAAAQAEPPAKAPAAAQPKERPAVVTRSDPAYAQKLAAALRVHVPTNPKVGAGTASCRFQVTANGAISGINCKGSSPAHSQLLQKAVAATKAPPPPGGSFSANQSVVFH